ncbi:MAG TPA: malate/lactate/ureidoglycolate dehydrogenase [Burkholderiaceae bacterium]|nr:malate/lactate/ureidoglycolate dehydrogenase [Burkholderiaceae bacterium]
MAERRIDAETLSRWVVGLFEAAGSDSQEARLAAEHLVGANLAGHDSHGVGMIPRYVLSLKAGALRLNQRIEIRRDSGALVAIDGRQGLGQSVAWQAMNLAIERTREHGICAIALTRAHHIGRIGHWAEQALAAGFASIHFVNVVSKVYVAPFGGVEPRFATNPFTVGLPRRNAPPLLLDFATSAIAFGKTRVAFNKGVPVAEGSLIDADGKPTTDPSVMHVPPFGALLPMGLHKGYALAMICELLGSALAGGPTAHDDSIPVGPEIWNGMFAIVFDPARLGDPDEFEAEAQRYEKWIKSARLAPGVDRIRMPGEPELDARAQRLADGIAIDTETLSQLDSAARAIGNDVPLLSPLTRAA